MAVVEVNASYLQEGTHLDSEYHGQEHMIDGIFAFWMLLKNQNVGKCH